jgi:iron complex transport system substrate-binding protein
MKTRNLLVICVALFFAASLGAKEITDMSGYKVVIPDHPQRVLASSPPLVVLLHAVNQDAMIGLNFPVPPAAAEFFPPRVAQLPVVGGVFGMGPQMNSEAVMQLHPDFALAWNIQFIDQEKVKSTFAKIGLPLVFIKLDNLADWPAALRFTGGLLEREKQADELARYVEQTLIRLQPLQTIPEAKRPRVYYAEGPDGLATDCNQSIHAEAIELAGGYNVYRCASKDHMGMEKVSMEQVLAYAPEIIIATDPGFVASVRQSPRWQGVKAVQTGRIYLVPRWPHNWVDRPPSVMRALGAQWLANLFYPQEYPLDLAAETRHFYHLFLGVELSDAQLQSLFK